MMARARLTIIEAASMEGRTIVRPNLLFAAFTVERHPASMEGRTIVRSNVRSLR